MITGGDFRPSHNVLFAYGVAMDQIPSGQKRLLEAIQIKAAGIDDLAAVRRLVIASFRAYSSAEHSEEEAAAMLAWLDSPAATDTLHAQTLMIAWLDRVPVAVAGWRMADDSGRAARLGTFAVDPMYGYLGLGRLIVGVAERGARKAGYHDIVVHSSSATEGFFHAIGFEITAYSMKSVAPSMPMRVTYMRKHLPNHDQIPAPVALQAGMQRRGWPTPTPRKPRPQPPIQGNAASAGDEAELGRIEFTDRPMLSKASH
jgi:predicted N-acetyltransferase YhbS